MFAILFVHSVILLCNINLFEHFLPYETLVAGGLIHTETNVENNRKLPMVAAHTSGN